MHPDIHGKSVSLAPYRLGSNLRSRSREEPGTNNLCFRSQEEMLTGLKYEEAFRYGPI